MVGLGETVSSVQRIATHNPKTVVGFCSLVSVVEVAGCVLLILILASTGVTTWLIPWLALMILLIPTGILVTVLAIAARDPSKLMLGEVSGTEYAEIQRVSVAISEATREEPREIESAIARMERSRPQQRKILKHPRSEGDG